LSPRKGKTRKTPERVTMKISNLPEVLSCKTFHTKYTFVTAELCEDHHGKYNDDIV